MDNYRTIMDNYTYLSLYLYYNIYWLVYIWRLLIYLRRHITVNLQMCHRSQQEVVRRDPGVVKKPCLTLQRPDSQHQLTLHTHTSTHMHTYAYTHTVVECGTIWKLQPGSSSSSAATEQSHRWDTEPVSLWLLCSQRPSIAKINGAYSLLILFT